MAIKPTDGHLEWITDDDAAKFLAPSSTKRLQGWIQAEKPPFQYFNWAFRLIDRWLKWSETQSDENLAAIAANAQAISAEASARAAADATHASLTNNPHAVTKAQVGLANVPNLPRGTYVNAADGGPYASSVYLSISSFAENAWRSIGPTGSGAQTIWTALDLVPAGANRIFVRVSCNFQSVGSSNSYDFASVYARRYGSSVSVLPAAKIANFRTQNINGNCYDGSETYLYLPIDGSRRFDLEWNTTYNLQSGIGMYLLGWDWNA